MKTNNFCKENRPEAKKKLRLPDQLELVMEDGTVYRVRSFFVAEQQMGEVLTQIVMTDIRCKAMWAQNSRETLRTQLLAREQNASVERTRTLQAELNAIGKRLPDLDKLIQSAYEDKVLGRIPESVCVNLLNKYEAERREKQGRHKELTGQLAASRETESSVDAWLDMMEDSAQLEELDRPTLVWLIQKIEISERYTVDDHEERDIHIYYNFVGYIEA